MVDAGRSTRVLVVGLGNPILRDDAVGIRLARHFRRLWDRRPDPDAVPEADPRGARPGPAGVVAGSDPGLPRPAGPREGGIDLRFIEECSVGGLALVELFRDFDRVIVLDSIHTRGGRPGDWYAFTAAALRTTMNLSNVHDANFATALELGRRTGMTLPPDDRIVVFAVEIEDNLTFDERMSDALENSYAQYSEAIFAEVRRLLAS